MKFERIGGVINHRFASRWTLLLMASSVVLPACACAQGFERTCTPGVNRYNYMFGGRVSKFPYTAVFKSSFEQKLGDGTYIRGTATSLQARDSKGKSRTESGLACLTGEEGKPHSNYQVSIWDPAGKTTMNWQVQGNAPRMARISHQAEIKQIPLTPEQIAGQKQAEAEMKARRKEYKLEDLGNRTIAGVEAHGTRSTRTIPAGEEGNEVPLVVVTETWECRELGINVMGIMDDPRMGKTAYEAIELTRGEPDPGLFVPPAGFKLMEVSHYSETEVTSAAETH